MKTLKREETHTNFFLYDEMRRWIHGIHVGSQWMEMCGADMGLFLIYSYVSWLSMVFILSLSFFLYF